MVAAPCQAADVEWILIQANREERNRFRAAAALSDIKADHASGQRVSPPATTSSPPVLPLCAE